ncbi:MAG: Spy/CpxP family protein refolding chaperone [Gammaproteobacteria bacterium]
MKQFITLLVTAFIFAQPAFAEHGDKGKHMDKRGHHMDRMIEELQLNGDQVDTFRQIMKEQRGKHRAVFQEMRDQMKPKMEAIHEETRQRLSTVLNEQQLQRFDEMTNKMRERMEKRKFGHHQHNQE